MSLSAYVGTFTQRASAGTDVITGVGFQPKAVMFWWVNLSAQGMFNSAARFAIGFDDGTNAVAVNHNTTDNTAASDTSIDFDGSNSLLLVNLNQTVDSLGKITTLGADGFTVTWSAVGAGGALIHYLALGGDVSAKAGYFTSRIGAGAQSITGLGFQPSCALFLNALWTSSASPSAEDFHGPVSFGVGAESGQWVASAGTVDAANPSQTERYQVSTACISRRAGVTSGILYEAAFSSVEPDGFTVGWTLNPNQFNVPYLALGGISVQSGTLTQPAATGTQVVSTPDLTPRAVIVASVGGVASTTVEDEHRFSLGASDGTRQRVAWAGDAHNLTPTRGARYAEDDAIGIAVDTVEADGSTSTIDAELSVTALAEGSMTFSWVDADATAREFLYLALCDLVQADEPEFTSDDAIAGLSRGLIMVEFRNWQLQTLGAWVEET